MGFFVFKNGKFVSKSTSLKISSKNLLQKGNDSAEGN